VQLGKRPVSIVEHRAVRFRAMASYVAWRRPRIRIVPAITTAFIVRGVGRVESNPNALISPNHCKDDELRSGQVRIHMSLGYCPKRGETPLSGVLPIGAIPSILIAALRDNGSSGCSSWF
jgi:hypothetical protein